MRYTLNRPGDGKIRTIALGIAIAFHLLLLLLVLSGGEAESWMPQFLMNLWSDAPSTAA